MKKKYLINQVVYNTSGKYNAFSKAREDVTHTLRDLGYIVIDIKYIDYNFKLLNYIRYSLSLFLLTLKLKSHSLVYLQYPHFTYKALTFLIKLLKLKHIKICFIVHDIESLREKGNIGKYEIQLLNLANGLIVHTPAMQKYLENKGIRIPMSILNLFDYYTDGQERKDNLSNKKIVVTFAGNLDKSKFLTLLPTLNFSGIIFNLYGAKSDHITENASIHYKGKFSPEHIADLQGDWGLVWDGSELTGCKGYLGEYLKINSSHKLSLYLAAGMPVIVSSTSSLADYISDNKLGIAIPNLLVLEQKLKEITSGEVETIKKEVQKISYRLRNGDMLREALAILNNKLGE